MISIIIRCKNEEAYIGEVLAMLFEQIIGIDFEVIVLDSGSTDRTLEIVKKFNVRIYEMPPEEFTFGYALNKGISLAQGEIICNLSAHCIPVNNHWLKELVEPILSGEAHAVIGRQIPIRGMNPFEELAVRSLFPAVGLGSNSPHLSNANCAFLKTLWEENKFDEVIMGWEDYLWYLQMKTQYKFLYCPRAAVYHSHPFYLKYMVTRSYGDGKATRYIREKLGIDLTAGKIQSTMGKIRTVVADVRYTAKYLLSEKYYRFLLLLPLIKPVLYIAYLRGLKERTEPKRDRYSLWIKKNEPDSAVLAEQRKRSEQFEMRPKISIVAPVFNPDRDFFVEMVESVISQTYDNWELCLADASSELSIKGIIEKYVQRGEKRIKVKYLEQNGGIARNSNAALALATGDFVALLDHDDTLAPFALYEVVRAIHKHPGTDFIYSDRDKISSHGERIDPFFKPDWSPDYLLAQNYLCHLNVFRKTLIDTLGGFREGYDGSQDYDLVLRVTELTDNIVHIPKILYHWRACPGSAAGEPDAKPYAYEAAVRALQDAVDRRGWKGTVTEGTERGLYRMTFEVNKSSKVSIIIPAKVHGEVLKKCINSIIDRTAFRNYELVIADSSRSEEKPFESCQELENGSRVRLLRCGKSSNFSEAKNYAVSKIDTEYVLFLNADTEVMTENWIELLLGFARRKETGAVGAKLLSPDETVYAAGLILDEKGNVRRSHYRYPRNSPGYNGRIQCVQNVSAVSACVLLKKEVFEEAGGFDPRLSSYAEIDLCLKLREMNYLIVYNSHAELYYHGPHAVENEHGHERPEELKKERELFVRKWGHILKKGDPFYSPNLTTDKEDFLIKL